MKIFTKTILVTTLVFFTVTPVAFAATTPSQKMTTTKPAPVMMPQTSAAAMKEKSTYQLPYPGLLPDHPLYVLKALRDNILDALIVDPLRKAEFYLLLGDKYMSMGVMAAEKDKPQLTEQVATKGESYVDKALSGLLAQKTSGKEIPGYIIDRIEKALVKHIEVLEELLAKANDAQKAGLTTALDQAKRLQGDVGKLK